MSNNQDNFFDLYISEFPVADINKKDINGDTILFVAVKYNSLSSVEKLISRGADVNIKNNSNETLLHALANENKGESHFKIAEMLLKIGGDVNARDNRGITPFLSLVMRANIKMVKLFLNFNADVYTVSNFGRTPLRMAVFGKDAEVVQLLIDLGLSVNQLDENNETALHSALDSISKNDLGIIKCLLKNGSDVNAVSTEGFTPLIFSIRLDDEDDYIRPRRLEPLKKSTKFIVEYSDFNVVLSKDNILEILESYNNVLHSEYLWRLILKHLAKLQMLNLPVHPAYLDTISSCKKFNDYYKNCQEELLLMKKTRLRNTWVTFYNLLVGSRKSLKNYAGNEDLINDFEKSDCESKFPLYGASVSENVKKGIKRRELFDKSINLLSECLPVFNPTHLVVRDVLDCVSSKKDLLKFCKEN